MSLLYGPSRGHTKGTPHFSPRVCLRFLLPPLSMQSGEQTDPKGLPIDSMELTRAASPVRSLAPFPDMVLETKSAVGFLSSPLHGTERVPGNSDSLTENPTRSHSTRLHNLRRRSGTI